MISHDIISWLLKSDISIQYQCRRDLLDENVPDLQKRIDKEGWAAELMFRRNPDGSWGRGFYSPKWTSSHYSLLDLRHLCVYPDNPLILESIEKIALENKAADGGINPAKTIPESDVCVNGMFLNYASYFGLSQKYLTSVIDFIISQQLPDGGFNCQLNRTGAKHSSLHSTLSIAEGICEYLTHDYEYRREELAAQEKACREFMLMHQLYISDRTGEIIKPDFLRLVYPGRWKYDILRALDYFRYAECSYDERMEAAIQQILKKQEKNGRWKLRAHYPGKHHFEMEEAGRASRWNTLRALRVLKHFKPQEAMI